MDKFGVFLLVLAAFLAPNIPLSKPSRVGFTAGINRSWTAPFPLIHVEDGGGSSPVTRMRVGVATTMPVRQRFAIQLGAAYSRKGEISSYTEHFLQGPLIEDRVELDYLEFSMLGRVGFPLESDALHPHLLAGPALAVGISCRKGRKTARRLSDCTTDLVRIDIVLSGGGGVDLRLNERLDATLGLLYGLSLRTPFDYGDHLRNLTLRGGLAYRLD